MGWFGTSFTMWLLRRPRVMTALFSVFKNLPGFNPLNNGLLLDASTAREVLGRGGDFEVGPTSAPKMLARDFLHGMDKFPRYELDRDQVLTVLMDPDNLKHLREITATKTSYMMSEVFPKPEAYLGKKIDLFASFVQPVVTQTILEFYGLNVAELKSAVVKGSGEDLACRLIRLIGTLIALPHPAPFWRYQIGREACEGDEGLIQYVKNQIEIEFKKFPQGRPLGEGSVMQQLIGFEVQNQSEDVADKVLKRLFGIMATSTAINKLFINILKEMLRRQAQEKAQARTPMDDLVELVNDAVYDPNLPAFASEEQVALRHELRGYMLELLRFNIAFPGLPRYCPRSTTVQTPEGKTHFIKKDTVLTTMLPATMFDNQEWPEPDKFCPHRNQEKYTHFGAGQHQCVGQELSLVVLEEMFVQFLRLDEIKKTKILKVVNDGPTYEAVQVKMGGGK